MKKHTPSRGALAILACLSLLLAGAVAITPAGASLSEQVSSAAQQNWNKIWKQKIRPRADKRYYTKKKADKRYAQKVQVWTRTEADAKYATKADTWTKAETYSRTEADAKFATKPKLLRGTYAAQSYQPAAGALMLGDISFGVTLPAAPVPHYIPTGTPPPAGCSGTPAAPDASPGHLCVFETLDNNVGARNVAQVSPPTGGAASTMGAWVYASSAAAGNSYFAGSWAVRFDTSSAGAKAPAPRSTGPNPFR